MLTLGYFCAKRSPAGVHLDAEFLRLGIAEEIKAKAIRPDTDIVSKLVANGDLDVGIVVVTQILTTPGVELVGRLPAELQYFVEFAGGVATSSTAPAESRALLKLLKQPAAISVMRSQGMEPG